jgi:hypothetical protein
MSFQIKAEILGNMDSFARAMNKSAKQMGKFEKTAKNISGSIKMAWAGVAALGLTAVYDAIVDVTKAASQDAKSVALMNKQMDNSWKATKAVKEEMGLYLDTISNATGILDDDLRPAFSKIIAVTKGSNKAMKYFDIAMDTSAGTGKDLNVVTQAMAKFLGGNKTALDKLIPGLKDAGDKMAFLQTKYGGMAETAGQNDPFARINAVLENFKEKIGTAFLPLIDKLADWLASDDAQKSMNDFAMAIQDMFSYFTSPEGKKGMEDFLAKILEIADGITALMKEWEKMKPLVDFLMWTTGIAFTPLKMLGEGVNAALGAIPPSTSSSSSSNKSSSVVNIYGTVSGNDVVKALKNVAGQKGMTIGRLLR